MRSLDDYDTQDIIEHLEDQGYRVSHDSEYMGRKGLWINPDQLGDIERLLIAGQKEAAQNDLFNLLGKTLHRSMT